MKLSLVHLLAEMDSFPQFSLLLPELRRIQFIRYLPVKTLLRFCQTRKEYFAIAKDPKTWRYLLERDFKYDADEIVDPRKIYQETYPLIDVVETISRSYRLRASVSGDDSSQVCFFTDSPPPPPLPLAACQRLIFAATSRRNGLQVSIGVIIKRGDFPGFEIFLIRSTISAKEAESFLSLLPMYFEIATQDLETMTADEFNITVKEPLPRNKLDKFYTFFSCRKAGGERPHTVSFF